MFFHDILDLDIVNFFPIDVNYGLSLTAVGFFLAISGVLFFPKTEDSPESNDGQNDEIDTQGDEE